MGTFTAYEGPVKSNLLSLEGGRGGGSEKEEEKLSQASTAIADWVDLDMASPQ